MIPLKSGISVCRWTSGATVISPMMMPRSLASLAEHSHCPKHRQHKWPVAIQSAAVLLCIQTQVKASINFYSFHFAALSPARPVWRKLRLGMVEVCLSWLAVCGSHFWDAVASAIKTWCWWISICCPVKTLVQEYIYKVFFLNASIPVWVCRASSWAFSGSFDILTFELFVCFVLRASAYHRGTCHWQSS